MTTPRETGERLAEALVAVIEQARWDARIRSARALAEAAGMTHTYLNKRLNQETQFTVRDLGALAGPLKTTPAALVEAAQARMDIVWSDVDLVVDLGERRGRVEVLDEAAREDDE